MRPAEDIKSITYMKMQSAALVQRVRSTRRPVVITQNGEASAVVMDVESYQALRDAAILVRLLAQSEREVQAGDTMPQRAVFERMERRLRAARGSKPRSKLSDKR